VRRALAPCETPFYLFSIEPIREALRELKTLEEALQAELQSGARSAFATPRRSTRSGSGSGPSLAGVSPHRKPIRIRHWLSCKTQPVRPLLEWWRQQGMGIEVVSEFEFLAAMKTGFPPERILVNGPAKHYWLPRHAVRGLFVNFYSMAEAAALVSLAKKLDWRAGVRCLTDEEFDPEKSTYPTQFGLAGGEAVKAFKMLMGENVRLEMVHFHLRTNVASPASYERALGEVADLCRAAGFQPKYLDCGGGVPPPNILSPEGRRYDAQFSLRELANVYCRALKRFPGVQELWLENGRFISARSGALVLTILDAKERRGMRQLICNSGRTTNALVSNWEAHEIISLPERRGPVCPTTVCGPTCMAFDQLARRSLPRSLRAGDHLVWLDAGAYHIPWETRFSHGYSKVLWHDGKNLKLIRRRESFASWWGQWQEEESP